MTTLGTQDRILHRHINWHMCYICLWHPMFGYEYCIHDTTDLGTFVSIVMFPELEILMLYLVFYIWTRTLLEVFCSCMQRTPNMFYLAIQDPSKA